MGLGSDFTDCSVFIYDVNDNHIGSTTIIAYNKSEQRIRISAIPKELKVNDNCRVFILSSPSPCEFQGKLKREGSNSFIALFQGHEKDNRGAARYNVNAPALIDYLFVDGKAHPLQTPIRIELINISTGGVRFRAPFYSLEKGDTFRVHLSISNNKKMIIAEVTNCIDNEPEYSDYGCLFLRVE